MPAKSCQRARISPRSSEPSLVAWSISACAPRYAPATAARRSRRTACCASSVRGQVGDPGAERVEHAGHRLGEHGDPPVVARGGVCQPFLDRPGRSAGSCPRPARSPGSRTGARRRGRSRRAWRSKWAVSWGSRTAAPGTARRRATRPGPARTAEAPRPPRPRTGWPWSRTATGRTRPGTGGRTRGAPGPPSRCRACRAARPLAACRRSRRARAARPAGHGQALLADPRQRGQEHVLREPVDLVGMTGEHRAVGGRPRMPVALTCVPRCCSPAWTCPRRSSRPARPGSAQPDWRSRGSR